MKLRVIAPSNPISILSQETVLNASGWFRKNWFIVDFGRATSNNDTSIVWRASDINDAFADNSITHIFSWIWWHNCIELVNKIDFDIIRSNPKFICWYSDITILLNAIFQKTGIITYLGPHFSSLWIEKWNIYTQDKLISCIFWWDKITYESSNEWSDDDWFIDQQNRNFIKNPGIKIINHWVASWRIIWWNISSLNLLRWTDYFPSLEWSILFIEDARTFWEESFREFKRNLYSILNDSKASLLKWIIIWRFQLDAWFNDISDLKDILENFNFTKEIPIIYWFDSWHTTPIFTIPIGSNIDINTHVNKIQFTY